MPPVPSEPPRLTLVVGPEDVLVSRAVSAALQAARRADPTVIRRDVDAGAESAAADIAEALSPTLFDDGTVVVVSSLHEADDATAAVIKSAITELPAAIWLVLLHPGGVKGKALLQSVRSAGTVEVAAPAMTRMREVLDFLAAEVSSRRRRMSREALSVIYDAIGSDLGLLLAAVSQVLSDIEADPIDVAEVSEYFGGVAGVSGFAIADAVWSQRPTDALRSMRWAVETGDGARIGPPTVGAIAAGLRSLVAYAGAPRGLPEAEIAKAAGVPPWKVRTLREQLQRWRPEWLAAAAVRLAAADAAVKGGLREGENLEPAQKVLALERLVVETASPPRSQ